MSNIKKIVIISIVVLLIALIILGIVLFNEINMSKPDEIPSEPVEIDSKICKVTDRSDFFAIKTCINKFYTYLYNEYSDEYKIIDEETKKYMDEKNKNRADAIYSMLDSKYIEYKGISRDNVFDVINRIDKSSLQVSEMFVSQRDANTAVYIAYGMLRDEKTKKNTDFEIMIKVDMKNETFKVLLQDYIDANFNNIKEGQELLIDDFKEIKNDTYNIFDYKVISEEEYINNIFNEFKSNLMYDHKMAYSILDTNYAQKRFPDFNEFDEYIRNNIRDIVIMKVAKYQVNNYDNYTQYVLIDQNGEYYIFNETAVMDYTVILDTYTIELPQFTEKYNSSTDAEKVLLNIQKVFEAINNGDYRYVYNKLDQTFKQTNFPTQEDFENYIKQNFYKNNSISYSTYKTSGDLHIYDIAIKDKDNEANPEKTKTFIMQLKEGTDFVMSFNVD